MATKRSIEYKSRGAFVDRTTQRWVQATGRRVALDECAWLEGPVGDVDVIGADFFARFADREGLTMVTNGPPRGLVENFTALAGLRSFSGERAGRGVLRTDLRVRVRRLVGVAWRIPAVWQRAGRDLQSAIAATKRAIVLAGHESRYLDAPNGSFTVRSSGRSFGDPGFYFFVEAEQGQGWARYLRALKEDIRVYVDPRGHLRADHNLQIWGATFLRLRYRITKNA